VSTAARSRSISLNPRGRFPSPLPSPPPRREGETEGGAWGRPPRPSAIHALTERDGQHCRVGNKMGTGLAISAQCGYNVRASGQYRNCLAIKAFKYHRNVFPIPRVWQTYRTQNPVLARGCGFKSHLRYSRIGANGNDNDRRRASLTPQHARQCIDNHCPAVTDRRSRLGSRRRYGALVIIPAPEPGNGGIACLNSSARGRGGDK
jgi:hypothetical protein